MLRFIIGLSLVIVGCSSAESAPLWYIPAFAVPGLAMMLWALPKLAMMEE